MGGCLVTFESLFMRLIRRSDDGYFEDIPKPDPVQRSVHRHRLRPRSELQLLSLVRRRNPPPRPSADQNRCKERKSLSKIE